MVNQIVRVKPTAHRCRDFWSSIDHDFLEQSAGSMISRKSYKILFGVVGMVSNHVGMTFSVLRRLVGFEVVDVRMNARKDRLQQIQGAYEKCGRLLSPGLGVDIMGQDAEGSLRVGAEKDNSVRKLYLKSSKKYSEEV